jgi:maltose alpha-D-glucosyltransferase/alpha-amylase
LLNSRNREKLESDILSDYLLKTDWFAGKGHPIHGIAITNSATLPLTDGNAYA